MRAEERKGDNWAAEVWQKVIMESDICMWVLIGSFSSVCLCSHMVLDRQDCKKKVPIPSIPSSIFSPAVPHKPFWGAKIPLLLSHFFYFGCSFGPNNLEPARVKFHHSGILIAGQMRPQGAWMGQGFHSGREPERSICSAVNHIMPENSSTSRAPVFYSLITCWLQRGVKQNLDDDKTRASTQDVPECCSSPGFGSIGPSAGQSCLALPPVCWTPPCSWRWTAGPGSWSRACPWWAASPPGLLSPSGGAFTHHTQNNGLGQPSLMLPKWGKELLVSFLCTMLSPSPRKLSGLVLKVF